MEHNNKLYLTSDNSILFDDHYRYQMSTLQISLALKKGTYITIIDNYNDFCDELIFDKNLLIKVIGKSLSCKSGIDKHNNAYLQGQYAFQDIKNIVYSFIQNYLLCINCDKPEIRLKYKNNKIKQKCRACGNNSYLDNCKEEIIHILKNL
jgi:translation initiation factor 2 beta subunit (eIF-2beta)/eIF-5